MFTCCLEKDTYSRTILAWSNFPEIIYISNVLVVAMDNQYFFLQILTNLIIKIRSLIATDFITSCLNREQLKIEF